MLTFSGDCKIKALDLESLPRDVASLFQHSRPELVRLGFECVGFYDCGSVVSETHTYVAYFCNRETNDFANVTARVSFAGCSSCLEANGVVETNTSAARPLTPSEPQHRVLRVPGIQKAEELYRIHRQLVEKYAPGLWAEGEPRGEEIERYKRVIENYGPRHARMGYARLVDGKGYKLTWRGAYLITLRGVWPVSLVRIEGAAKPGHRCVAEGVRRERRIADRSILTKCWNWTLAWNSIPSKTRSFSRYCRPNRQFASSLPTKTRLNRI